MISFPLYKQNRTIASKLELLTKNRHFLRFQLTALLATTIDFAITIVFESMVGFHYSLAIALGATFGAMTAFFINRFWVFSSMKTHPAEQAMKYFLIVAGSIFLNTTGAYLLTETTMLTYLISKAIVSIIIGFTYSYYFSKRFVFYA